MIQIWITVVILTVITAFALKLYSRLSVGRCDSQRDMTGKTVLITGASAGIGKFTALDLARRNARVLLACRNLVKAEEVKSEITTVTGNVNVEVKHLDLESFDSVRKCAEDVLRTEERLDVLINNAGTIDVSEELTEDGHEKTIQTNYIGHFLLTLLLLDLLKKSKPSRIINVSSWGYLFSFLNLNDLNGIKRNFLIKHAVNQYFTSKLAMILFTAELARRLSGTGITVNALHPGVIHTDIMHHFEHPTVWIYRYASIFLGKSVEEGAQTTIHLAVHPEVEMTTGKFFYDCREGLLLGQARDKVLARRLFQISEKIVGEFFPKNTSGN